MSLTVAKANTLDHYGASLPTPVLQALQGYRAVAALPAPAPGNLAHAVNQATSETAVAAARKAASRGKLTLADLDPSPIAAARAADADTRDRLALHAAVRQASEALLLGTIVAQRAGVLRALKDRHRVLVTELVPAAHNMPAGASQAAADTAGEPLRSKWNAFADLAGRLEAIRNLVTDCSGEAGPRSNYAAFNVHVAHVRSKLVYDHYSPMSGGPTKFFGGRANVGDAVFYFELGRLADPDVWWCPTPGEADAQAAKLWPAPVTTDRGLFVGAPMR